MAKEFTIPPSAKLEQAYTYREQLKRQGVKNGDFILVASSPAELVWSPNLDKKRLFQSKSEIGEVDALTRGYDKVVPRKGRTSPVIKFGFHFDYASANDYAISEPPDALGSSVIKLKPGQKLHIEIRPKEANQKIAPLKSAYDAEFVSADSEKNIIIVRVGFGQELGIDLNRIRSMALQPGKL